MHKRTKVIVGGARGRMGAVLVEHIKRAPELEIAGLLEAASCPDLGKSIEGTSAKIEPASTLSNFAKKADVYVDFTSPVACEQNSITAAQCGMNLVVGTTGLTKEQLDNIKETVHKNNVSAVMSPNFSVGVNVFWKLNQQLASYMKGSDIEMIEVHHNKKKDAPSGTAKKTIDIISKEANPQKIVHGRHGDSPRKQGEIGVFAIRGGDVIGEHTVMYFGDGERLEFTHRAHSRDCFAAGCVKSIIWVSGKKDGKVHSFPEVLGF